MLYKEDIEILRDLIARMDERRIVQVYFTTTDENRINALCEDKYLVRIKAGGSSFWITPKALSELAAIDERLDHENKKATDDAAKQKKKDAEAVVQMRQNRHHDYHVATFGAIIGVIATLLIEHFDDIIALGKNVTP